MAKTSSPEHQRVIAELADLLRRAAPLAELVDSDDYSQAERELLRELTGPKTFFHLSTHLNRLCGERARQMMTEVLRRINPDRLDHL